MIRSCERWLPLSFVEVPSERSAEGRERSSLLCRFSLGPSSSHSPGILCCIFRGIPQSFAVVAFSDLARRKRIVDRKSVV